MTLYDFLANYFVPVLVLFSGIVLAFIAFLFALARAEGSGDEKTQRIGKWSFPIVRVPKNWKTWANLMGWLLIAGSIVSSVVIVIQMTSREVVPIRSVSLMSMKYMTGDWNPREINLLTVADDGISVAPGVSLRLFDIMILVPKEADQYYIGAEVYGGGDLIGTSGFQRVNTGLVKLNDFKLRENYIDPDVPDKNAWETRNNWDKLDLYVYLYPNDQPGVKSVSTLHTVIRIRDGGGSWYLKPPYAHIVGLEYSINGEQTQSMDLVNILDVGLPVTAGDEIVITKVWYKANSEAYGQKIQLEAYLTAQGYNSDRLKTSPLFYQQSGVFDVPDISGFTWVLLPDEKRLIITLSSEDRTVLDRFVIPVNK